MIEIEDFKKIELKVGQILNAERIEKSDKLLKIEVDLKEEKRQIIAGIGNYYSPEQLIGKKIIVITNLKSRKLMGFESQGMLLAAQKNDKLTLLTVLEDIENGAFIS